MSYIIFGDPFRWSIFLGSVKAKDKDEVIERIKGLECDEDRIFDFVVVFEVCG
ncbi:MAG: hypothetical protein KAJ14_05995 [Candidatus Omnitrophica bacterium]|nr:hypothetical protein [Candidatus Omnitrophota bacterium]